VIYAGHLIGLFAEYWHVGRHYDEEECIYTVITCGKDLENSRYERFLWKKYSCINPLKPKLVWIIFKYSVPTSRETKHFSITKINWQILVRETVAVYSENHSKHINTAWAKCGVTDRYVWGTRSYHSLETVKLFVSLSQSRYFFLSTLFSSISTVRPSFKVSDHATSWYKTSSHFLLLMSYLQRSGRQTRW
jgi:hypothetical protein